VPSIKQGDLLLTDDDIKRLEQTYQARNADSDNRLYALANPSYLFAIQQRERRLLQLLTKHNLLPLHNKKILEVGCGRGGVLLEYLRYGAMPYNLFGVDYLIDRLDTADEKLSSAHWANADGQRLPYADHIFDIVIQYTALSSLLDPAVRQNVAAEMRRVVNKQHGVIVWYDFWLNPKNPDTHGIRPQEIKSLFPDCQYDFRKITLAPPLARRIAPISWMLAVFLENLTIFNSHYLAVITPKS
jgi:ubiquinone/menaquinone biosynthesis C-methylase UbiE